MSKPEAVVADGSRNVDTEITPEMAEAGAWIIGDAALDGEYGPGDVGPKPLEDGVPVAELGRKVAPRATGSRDPQHRPDKAPVIRGAATGVGFLPPAMRFHFGPLGIG